MKRILLRGAIEIIVLGIIGGLWGASGIGMNWPFWALILTIIAVWVVFDALFKHAFRYMDKGGRARRG